MRYFLGVDTSNYTTSAAFFDSETGEVIQKKRMLPVKRGERGLRQSDAVFHHNTQLPEVLEELFSLCPPPHCIGVSVKPESRDGSYMPCFLAGECAARVIAAAFSIPIHRFSHQQGHIVSALYSAKRLDLLSERFLAFHISGGTTSLLLVTPNGNKLFNTKTVASTLDLKAGQLVDRIGVNLGFPFPAGKMLDETALLSQADYFTGAHFKLKDGDCSLSGLENKAYKMLEEKTDESDVARFIFDNIALALNEMYQAAAKTYGSLPILFSGGVTSSKALRQRLSDILPAIFSHSEFSSDNAAGVAVLSFLEEK